MRRPLFVVALCLVIIAGVRLHTGAADRVGAGCISTKELSAARNIQVTGQVYQKDDQSIYIKSVVLSDSNHFIQSTVDSQQEISTQNIRIWEKLICETERASEIPLGSVVTVSGVFMPFSQASNPGEFDSALYYRTLGIGGKLRKARVLYRDEQYWPLREQLYQVKCRLRERLYAIFPQQEAAVMEALLLGDKGNLDSELKELYKRNGILHILSISSMHITIIGVSIYQLLRRMGLPMWAAAVLGCAVLLVYGCITGFGVSACRAIGMYLIKMLGEVVGRTYDMLTALGVVGAIMATLNPYYLLNGGFVLSFTCVLGIGLVYPAFVKMVPRRIEIRQSGFAERLPGLSGFLTGLSGFLPGLCKSFLASLSIAITTLPVQLWLYYEVPVYSVFLNLLIIPLLKPLMYSGLAALALPRTGVIQGVPCLILWAYEFLCQCFDGLPFHSWNPGCPKAWQIILYYVLLGAAVILGNLPGDRHRAGLWRGILRLSFLCLGVAVLGRGPRAENRVAFLDVGQGDCIVVQTASGENYLFDCGSTTRSGVGNYVLIPCLKYMGISELDAVFVSHPDKDHVSGILELLELKEKKGIKVKQLILPAIDARARTEEFEEILAAAGMMEEDEIAVRYLSAGDRWECDSASFVCLHPREGYSGEDSNAYSECVFVEFRERENVFASDTGPEWSLLLTGDVEGAGEAALLAALSEQDLGENLVLKAAHHGSKYSTTEEFLELTQPMLTVISCGENNSYGHPHQELLDRLKECGTYIIQTAESGAVTVLYRKGSLEVSVMK